MKTKPRKEPLYIFLHLPKTGGTTFSKHIKENLDREEWFCTTQHRYGFDKRSLKDKRVRKKIKIILGHATYYGIHKLFPDREARYILFLRDPIKRIISLYNFEMRTIKQSKSFGDWYKIQLKNGTTLFLSNKYNGKEGSRINMPRRITVLLPKIKILKNMYFFFQKIHSLESRLFRGKNTEEKYKDAKKLVDACWHIGFVENLDRDLKYLFKTIKVPINFKNKNVSKKYGFCFKLSKDEEEAINQDNIYDIKLCEYAKSRKRIFKNK